MVALRTRALCADLCLAEFGPDASANWEVPFWSMERSFGLIGGELRGISATRRSSLFCYPALHRPPLCRPTSRVVFNLLGTHFEWVTIGVDGPGDLVDSVSPGKSRSHRVCYW